MRAQCFVVSVIVFALGGCANVNSIYRTLDLGPGASAVAVDIKQRALLSTKRPVIGSDGALHDAAVVCAEPSPDALSAYSASGGLSALLDSGTGAAKEQAQLAFAAGEKAASVGLRTQSIQLLRDGLFTDCAAFMNQAIDGEKWYQLRRRNQDFTLGLLAIEQLTGAVKADQAALDASSSAGSGSDNVDKQVAAVDAAQKTQSQAVADSATADAAAKDAQTARDDANTSLLKLKAAQAALKSPDDATKAKAQADVDAAQKDLDAKSKDLGAKVVDQGLKKRAVDGANELLATARESLQTAQMRVRAEASGSARLAESGGARAAVTGKVAAIVAQIVHEVLQASGQGELCQQLSVLVASLPQTAVDSAAAQRAYEVVARACPASSDKRLAFEVLAPKQPAVANLLLLNLPSATLPLEKTDPAGGLKRAPQDAKP